MLVLSLIKRGTSSYRKKGKLLLTKSEPVFLQESKAKLGLVLHRPSQVLVFHYLLSSAFVLCISFDCSRYKEGGCYTVSLSLLLSGVARPFFLVVLFLTFNGAVLGGN